MDGATTTLDPMSDPLDQTDAGDETSRASEEAAAAESSGLEPHESSPPDPDHSEVTPRQVVEAMIFASENPLTAVKLARALDVGGVREVRQYVRELNDHYEQTGAAFRIQEIAGGYQMTTLPVFHTWLTRLQKAKQETRLSAASLETLAVVAYKQPVTRAEIEAVRGVSAGEMLNRLRELDMVKIVGRAEDLGRPILYGTTRRFLEVFGLPDLTALPKMEGPLFSSGLSQATMEASAGATAASIPTEGKAPLDDGVSRVESSPSADDDAAESGA